jgi:radical SAM family RiPP maturation amino acid epimerase
VDGNPGVDVVGRAPDVAGEAGERRARPAGDDGAVPQIKRFLERCAAEAGFIDRAREHPAAAGTEAGIELDPATFRQLWDREFAQAASAASPPPIVEDYRRGLTAKLAFRDRAIAESRPADPRMAAWRDRQIARGAHEISAARMGQIINAPFAIELNRGCSVGCWFCGVSAPELSDVFRYADNVQLWRDILHVLRETVGETAARWGFCYWATDPFDNPDYERFLLDFHAIAGVFPQTTTALALRDPARTRALLRLAEAHGCAINRFSILTLRQFKAVHAEFTADELASVECLPQNRESFLVKANAGRARDRHRRDAARRGEPFADEGSTIACVSGFLLNMVDRSVRLISPSRASDRWPLGYYVFDEGRFDTAEELGRLLRRMIDARMWESVEALPAVRFADGLAYEPVAEGFRLSTPYQVTTHTHPELGRYLQELGGLIGEGRYPASDLALLAVYRHGVPTAATLTMLEAMFARGLLNELPA